jgi:hypothetical protein
MRDDEFEMVLQRRLFQPFKRPTLRSVRESREPSGAWSAVRLAAPTSWRPCLEDICNHDAHIVG